jgi:xanthine dehydrogenase small subunit
MRTNAGGCQRTARAHMLDHLLVYLNGRRHEVRGPDAFLSLSDYLRRVHRLVGTKIVCSEGDCGACTVLIGRATEDGSHLVYRPVDSCIQFMFQLDGAHVVTIEGLGHESTPDAVQQAMIDCHGSQCGFCTPGFVVAMTGLLEKRESLNESEWRRGLTGNLCRCTGYTPILEAGGEIDLSRHRRLNNLYPADAMLAEFNRRRDEPILIHAAWDEGEHLVASPSDLPSAFDFLHAHPDAVIVAGATDLGVRANKTHSMPRVILDLNRIRELEQLTVENGALVLGARASWSSIERVCRDLVPELDNIIARFGGCQIRHVGTIGGNIANASPIADSLPFLFVMEAVLELSSRNGTRKVPITEFYRGYKSIDLRPGELITRVRVPLPTGDDLLRLYKISRRRDLDIASFTAAIRMRLDGDTIEEAAIAFGAVAPTVIRAGKTEAFLRGRSFDEDTMRAAGDIAVQEIAPISDVRGAADYRYQLTRNILLKFYHEAQIATAHV